MLTSSGQEEDEGDDEENDEDNYRVWASFLVGRVDLTSLRLCPSSGCASFKVRILTQPLTPPPSTHA